MKKTSRSLFLLSVVAILVLIAAGCSASPNQTDTDQDSQAASTEASSASDGAVNIQSYKLYADNGSGEKGEEVTSFTAGNHVQFFDVQLTGFLTPGSTVKWVFTAVDTTAGKDIKITEVEIKVAVGNNLEANLKMNSDFPVGTYKADISVDGKPLGTIDYTVTE